MEKGTNKSLNRKIISSSSSVVISLSLVLFTVGLLALLIINTQRLSNYIKENIGFTIMLNDKASEIEIIKLQKVLDAADFAISSKFISKEQATIDLQNDLGEDFVSFLGYSPLLASIDVKVNANYANTDSLSSIKLELHKNTSINEIFYQENLIDKINKNVNRITFFMLCFCILLLVIAFALINNTIRLSVHSKRFLIRTMRLVGANNRFILKPFLIKGIYQGVYSSIFAIFLLIGSIQLIQNETTRMLNVTDIKVIAIIFLLIFIAGFLLSWLSTFFAVRKFIYQKENELYN